MIDPKIQKIVNAVFEGSSKLSEEEIEVFKRVIIVIEKEKIVINFVN